MLHRNTNRSHSEHIRDSLPIPAPASPRNPFATPRSSHTPIQLSRPNSQYNSSPPTGRVLSPVATYAQPRRRKFKSARFRGSPEEYEKPWLEVRDPRRKWEGIMFWVAVMTGVAIGGIICYFAFSAVSNHEYCLILEDNFGSLDTNIWKHEIQRGGFGTGSFDWTTDDPKNAFVDHEGLHIVPTLTNETTDITPIQMMDNFVLNLTTDGTCTTTSISDCSIRSNKTAGTIINPVRSARLTTKGTRSIKYGKVEVVAKLPKGSWLWPAIWMFPEDSVYGDWPKSGEIDIMESRGNSGDSYPDGRDSIISALHWGPIPEKDGFWRTSGKHNARRTDYSKSFHTYGLEWSENYLFTYIDTRLLQVVFVKFGSRKNMWSRGGFGEVVVNNSALFDPWSQTGKSNTPFDQPFYLILNVAVGSSNGFFKDGVGNKPWGDGSETSPKQFWDGRDQWLPTWGMGNSRGMTVKSVRMWQQGACGRK